MHAGAWRLAHEGAVAGLLCASQHSLLRTGAQVHECMERDHHLRRVVAEEDEDELPLRAGGRHRHGERLYQPVLLTRRPACMGSNGEFSPAPESPLQRQALQLRRASPPPTSEFITPARPMTANVFMAARFRRQGPVSQDTTSASGKQPGHTVAPSLPAAR
jgi:hypothetical protein